MKINELKKMIVNFKDGSTSTLEQLDETSTKEVVYTPELIAAILPKTEGELAQIQFSDPDFWKDKRESINKAFDGYTNVMQDAISDLYFDILNYRKLNKEEWKYIYSHIRQCKNNNFQNRDIFIDDPKGQQIIFGLLEKIDQMTQEDKNK